LPKSIQFGLIAVGFEKYGSEEALQRDAIKHLYDIYVNINKDADSDPGVKAAAAAWFKRMEDSDEDALRNWRVWRELSVKKYEEEYDRLNVHFDIYTGESKVGKKWQDYALQRMDEMGLLIDVDGMKLVDLEKWKLQKAVLRKKGASVPLTCLDARLKICAKMHQTGRPFT
jgi:arginyl-tRNA synthetase